MASMVTPSSTINLPTYALVGACAFAAGVTHTISAAIIAVELTGRLELLLPCLLVSVIASGITKHKGLSVYDQGMLNKKLESLQLLLMGPVSFKSAKDVMVRWTPLHFFWILNLYTSYIFICLPFYI